MPTERANWHPHGNVLVAMDDTRPMLKIAIDYGATMDKRAGDIGPVMQEIARALLARGHEVHVISAMDLPGGEEARVRADIETWGIPFTDIHCVGFDGDPEVRIDNRAGINKVKVMKRYGIGLLIDDNSFICDEVRKAGLRALQLG